MKRVLKIFLCAALLLPLNACGSAQDEGAVDALVDASMEIMNTRSANIDLELNIDNEDSTMPDTKIASQSEFIVTEDDLQLKANLSVAAVDGQSIEDLHFYLKDNCFYFDDAQTKGKISVPVDLLALMKLMGTNNVNEETIKDQYLELYSKIKWEDESKGIIGLTPNETKFQDEMNKANMEDVATSMKDMKLTCTIQNKQIQQIDMSLKLIKEEEELDCKLSITLSNINSLDEIEFPDFSDFVEIEMGNEFLDGQDSLPEDELEDLLSSENF